VKRANVANDMKAADDLCTAIAKAIGVLGTKVGDANAIEAVGHNLWRAQEEFDNPLVKANLLQSMGLIGCKETLPKVVQKLQDLNFQPHLADGLRESQTAYGAILGLQAYGDSSGYLAIYFASRGWYKDDVKRLATQALSQLKISGDPSVELIKVVENPTYSYDNKLKALYDVDASAAIPDDSKSNVAVDALKVGWLVRGDTSRDRTVIANLRKEAIIMITEYGVPDPDRILVPDSGNSAKGKTVYDFLKRSYQEGFDQDEQIGSYERNNNGMRQHGAINALVSLNTDKAAQLLNGFLLALHSSYKSGTLRTQPLDDDWARARAVIVGLGKLGRATSRGVLNTIIGDNWNGQISMLCSNALRKLKK
jgi:hypothetical protein